jgi:hypothetical protein
MSLNSEMDNHLVESRLDHLRLYNLRYVLCKPGTPTQPSVQLGDEQGGHAVFEWTEAKVKHSANNKHVCCSTK